MFMMVNSSGYRSNVSVFLSYAVLRFAMSASWSFQIDGRQDNSSRPSPFEEVCEYLCLLLRVVESMVGVNAFRG